MLLGVDTGGTFTDFVLFKASGLSFHKELSTPEDPSVAIERGIQSLGLKHSELHLVHGSTVATNAILERKGVKTLFITNRGLEDTLTIGRQTRAELYNLTPDVNRGWVSRTHCVGVSGRVDASGTEIEAVDANELVHICEQIEKESYRAVAVSLLFSFLDSEHEQRIRERLPDHLFISLSHQVLAEYREFERGATTFLNAYVGPLVQSYLKRLDSVLNPKHLFVMHSAGGVMGAEAAGRNAVRLALSGPAGGLVAAEEIGRQLNESNLLTFDMGGTSTDVALIQGSACQTTEAEIAGIPVSLPMLDIHTIGAGGGSIAWMDEAELPQVGPESAGADPGPVCYHQGGTLPTVTDANLILGRIPSDAKLAGTMKLDYNAAYAALKKYGLQFGISAEEAADAIIRIAEEHMAAALRVVSVQRGYNPEHFSLLSFGGAGGLHACALADKLGMKRVIVPLASGAFSALGMLAGRQQSEFSRTSPVVLDDDQSTCQLQTVFDELEREAMDAMPGLTLSFERRVDLRYRGQGFHLTVPMSDELRSVVRHFEESHRQAYGHQLDRPVEVVTARLTAFVEREELDFPCLDASEVVAKPCGYSQLYGVGKVSHLLRSALPPGIEYRSPCLVIEETSTLWVPKGWIMQATPFGHLILERCDEQ